jgi:hypothetical protein
MALSKRPVLSAKKSRGSGVLRLSQQHHPGAVGLNDSFTDVSAMNSSLSSQQSGIVESNVN